MRDNRHNITHQLLGKRDLKGRLLSDREREEIRDARYMDYIANQPDNITWAYVTDKRYDQIVAIIGKDAFNAWLDDMAAANPDPGALTWKEYYLMATEKLDLERKSHELPSIATPTK